MNFHKTAAVLLSLALLSTSLLTGCSTTAATNPQNEVVSLEIWHYYNGPQKDAFDQLVSEFNETVGSEENIVIEAYSQGNVNDLLTQVIDAANKKVGAKAVPDMFTAYADTAYAVDNLGLVANLDPYFTEEALAQYRSEYLEEGRFDAEGNLKIFPIAKSSELFFLNKTDWEPFAADTGVTPDQLQTYEGLIQAAEQYYLWTDRQTPEPEDGKAFFGRDAMANYFIIGCRQLGVEIFQSENGQFTLNLDEAVMRKLWDNYYVPYINGYFTAHGRFRSDDLKTGDILAFVGSNTGATYFPAEVIINDTEPHAITAEILPVPVFADGEPYAVQQGAGMVVAKSDARKEAAAVTFLKWFTDTDRNIAFATTSGYMPVKNAANDLERINAYLDTLPAENVSDVFRQAFSAALKQLSTTTLYTNKAFEGGTDARAVLDGSLAALCTQDRQAVVDMIAAGSSREAAVAALNTDAHFQQWLQSLEQGIMEAIAAQ